MISTILKTEKQANFICMWVKWFNLAFPIQIYRIQTEERQTNNPILSFVKNRRLTTEHYWGSIFIQSKDINKKYTAWKNMLSPYYLAWFSAKASSLNHNQTQQGRKSMLFPFPLIQKNHNIQKPLLYWKKYSLYISMVGFFSF